MRRSSSHWNRNVWNHRKWYTFKAKDIECNESIDYRVEYLTESWSDEALKVLVQHFRQIKITWFWNPVIKQKMVLVCYKGKSDEIVGLNMDYMLRKCKNSFQDVQKQVKSNWSLWNWPGFIWMFSTFYFSSKVRKKNLRMLSISGVLFGSCEHHGVDKYLSTARLVVSPQYRGHGIGEQILRAWGAVCQHFGIKLTSNTFLPVDKF